MIDRRQICAKDGKKVTHAQMTQHYNSTMTITIVYPFMFWSYSWPRPLWNFVRSKGFSKALRTHLVTAIFVTNQDSMLSWEGFIRPPVA